MKVKLNIGERVQLSNLLDDPQIRGSFATQSALEKARRIVRPSEEEVEQLNIRENELQDGTKAPGKITWNERGNEPKELEISDLAADKIVERLKELDEEASLLRVQMTLYAKFVQQQGDDGEGGAHSTEQTPSDAQEVGAAT